MTDDLYYRKLESTSTTDLVDMIREKDKRIAELEENNKWLEGCKSELAEHLGKANDRIAELEQKLEQTEKDLADYQFNYPTIKELEKEKCELLGIIQGKDKVIKDLEWQLQEVAKDNDNYQKENAELKKNFEESLIACGILKEKIEILSKPSPLESMQDVLVTTQKEAIEKTKTKLTKAKEIMQIAIEGIKHWGIVSGTERPFEKQAGLEFNLFLDKAEQFLSEVEK